MRGRSRRPRDETASGPPPRAPCQNSLWSSLFLRLARVAATSILLGWSALRRAARGPGEPSVARDEAKLTYTGMSEANPGARRPMGFPGSRAVRSTQATTRPRLRRAVQDLSQRGLVEQFDDAALHLEEPFALEPGKQPTDGFQLETEITADLFARHAQHEFVRRVAALVVTLGQVEQECGETLLGAHGAEQHHDVALA